MLRPLLAINIALLTEGAGMEWPKLETSMNRGVRRRPACKNPTIKTDTIRSDKPQSPKIRLSTRSSADGWSV